MTGRRDVLKLGIGASATAAVAATLGLSTFAARRTSDLAGVTRLVVAPVDVELAPDVTVRSIAFTDVYPAPSLSRVAGLSTVELCNAGGSDIVFHSAALAEPLINVPAHSSIGAAFRLPANTATGINLKAYRAYCLASGTIAGRAIADGNGEGSAAYDRLQILSINRWQRQTVCHPAPIGNESTAHDFVTFDDKLMRASEPIKVRNGDRVRFHFSNMSSERGVTLALPHHRFLVVSLDGHSVPMPRLIERLYLGPDESVDAIVTMDRPGKWVLGTTHREDRRAGLGRVVEYAGARGTPVESDYGIADWDYTMFGGARVGMNAVIEGQPLGLRFGVPPAGASVRLAEPTPRRTALLNDAATGRRYGVAMTNGTRELTSVQILGHVADIVGVAGQRTLPVRKDVVTLPSFTRVDIEFVARHRAVYLAHHRGLEIDKISPGGYS